MSAQVDKILLKPIKRYLSELHAGKLHAPHPTHSLNFFRSILSLI